MNIFNDLFQKITVAITSVLITITSAIAGHPVILQPTPTPSPIIETVEATPSATPTVKPTIQAKVKNDRSNSKLYIRPKNKIRST